DLDIVVTAVLSGETVGLWLNDGRGRFTAGDARLLTHAVRPVESVSSSTAERGSDVVGPASRRAGTALVALGYSDLPPPNGSAAGTSIAPLGSTLRFSSARPRSPPTHSEPLS